MGIRLPRFKIYPIVFKIANVVGGGCAIITFFDLIGHPAIVVGSSMYPTLEGSDPRWWHRDFVWLSAWRRKERELTVGDIVTFICPKDPTQTHIKRVAALEGDLVRPRYREELMIVPEACYWMESDNPNHANDSNIYGPVNRGLMKNRATYIIWPPRRWQRL